MPDAHELVELQSNSRIEPFGPGDTVRVSVRIREGDRERLQVFQGVVVKKGGKGPAASFTVRRVAHGIGVERIFPLFSPVIGGVEIVRRGDVRRARLYYLRGLRGRAARIREKELGPAALRGAVVQEAALESQEPAPTTPESPPSAPLDEKEAQA